MFPVAPTDLPDWARLHSADDLPVVDISRHEQGLAANIEHWLDDGLGYWLVRDRLTEAPKGVGGVRRSKENPDGTWSLYYRFVPEARQQGYAVEVARAAITSLKVVDPDAELRAALRPTNAAAIAVAEKIGLELVERASDPDGRKRLVFGGSVADL